MLRHKWLGVLGGLSILSAAPALAAVSNGFDSNNLYVLRNTDRVLLTHDKSTQITTSSNWTNKGITGGPAAIDGTFKAASGTLNSLGFSWSPTPGSNTPAGSRLFYIGADNLGYPILQEVDSSQNVIREAYVGRIVGAGGADFGGATVTLAGSVRYNPIHNTLMIPVAHNGTGTGGTTHLYVYEVTLPDSPVGTGVNGVNELQGLTRYQTYDTGITGANAGAEFVDVAPNGTMYLKSQTTSVLSFNSVGVVSGGTTGPGSMTTVVTDAQLNAVNNAANSLDGQWQAPIFRTVDSPSGSVIVTQRKTGAGAPYSQTINWNLGSASGSVLPGWVTTGPTYRGANLGIRDDNTDADKNNIFISSVSTTGAPGGVFRYDTAGAFTQWDTNTGTSELDIGIPVAIPEPATLALLGFGVLGLLRRRQIA